MINCSTNEICSVVCSAVLKHLSNKNLILHTIALTGFLAETDIIIFVSNLPNDSARRR
jgi:hypothetical protein